MRYRRLLPLLAALLALSTTAPGASAAVGYSRVIGGLVRPVFVTHAGGSSQFVVQQDGLIRVVLRGSIWTWLDLRTWAHSPADGGGAEEGLLGLAFHPQYRASGTYGYGRFYVYFTYRDGNNYVREYRLNNIATSTAAGATYRNLLKINHPTNNNHNGGMLAFGPDGYLYVGTGDGGAGGDPPDNAQNKDSLLGKILRILPAGVGYETTGNPFRGATPGLSEVWSYGLRNPWRFSFDRTLGALWVGDVGQNALEEINRSPADATRRGAGRGYNYGWDAFEGNACFEGPCPLTGHRPPVTVYSHSGSGGGNCSVTGGYVYRGQTYAALRGLYFFGDFCSGRVWTVSGTSTSSSLPATLRFDTPFNISSFGEGYSGELYFTTLNGELYRISGF